MTTKDLSQSEKSVELAQQMEDEPTLQMLLLKKLDALLNVHYGIKKLRQVESEQAGFLTQDQSATQPPPPAQQPAQDPFNGDERLRALYQNPEIKALQAKFSEAENAFQAQWRKEIEQNPNVEQLTAQFRSELETFEKDLLDLLDQKSEELIRKRSDFPKIEEEYKQWEMRNEKLAEKMVSEMDNEDFDQDAWNALTVSTAAEEREILNRLREAKKAIEELPREITEMVEWMEAVSLTISRQEYLPRIDGNISGEISVSNSFLEERNSASSSKLDEVESKGFEESLDQSKPITPNDDQITHSKSFTTENTTPSFKLPTVYKPRGRLGGFMQGVGNSVEKAAQGWIEKTRRKKEGKQKADDVAQNGESAKITIADLLTADDQAKFNSLPGSSNFRIATPESLVETPIAGAAIMKGQNGAIVFMDCEPSQCKVDKPIKPDVNSRYTLISRKDLELVAGKHRYQNIAKALDADPPLTKWRKVGSTQPAPSKNGEQGLSKKARCF